MERSNLWTPSRPGRAEKLNLEFVELKLSPLMACNLADAPYAAQIEKWISTARDLQLVNVRLNLSVRQHNRLPIVFDNPLQVVRPELVRACQELEYRPTAARRVESISILGRNLNFLGHTGPYECFLLTGQFFTSDLHLHSLQIARHLFQSVGKMGRRRSRRV